jgi:hypothetical protein
VKVVLPTEEEFVVVGVSVWSCGDYSSESPVEMIERVVVTHHNINHVRERERESTS